MRSIARSLLCTALFAAIVGIAPASAAGYPTSR